MADNLKTIDTVDPRPFKKLIMTIGELPTSFLESMTYYEMLAWFVDYLQNTIIPSVNNNAEALQELQGAFITLKNYVDNYFANLDVQEEINNKLDEMASDGTIGRLLQNITGIVNIIDFGAIDDGSTDCTNAINEAIEFAVENNINTVIVPKGNFIISDTITLYSNICLKGNEGSVLKFVGEGAVSKTLLSAAGTSGDNYLYNITIDGINIDGTGQVYKGGETLETPSQTSTKPGYGGLRCIKFQFVKDITIKNCKFNDIYGDGIQILNGESIQIINNTLNDVSSGNIQSSPVGYDNHGDGIYIGKSHNVLIDGNTVINKRVYLTGQSNAIGKPCGRSGLCFEYAINEEAISSLDPANPEYCAPGYENVPTENVYNDAGTTLYRVKWSTGLRMTNNYIYGYTKGIHLESYVKSLIENNTILYCHIGVLTSTTNMNSIKNNYINPYGVGKAPQGGFDTYYGCIAITTDGSKKIKYGTIVTGNVLEGNGCGVHCNSSYSNISNNTFRTTSGIIFGVAYLHDIIIDGNTFNTTLAETSPQSRHHLISTYYDSKIIIVNNIFLNENDVHTLEFVGGNNIKIKDNMFTNARINFTSNADYIVIKGNYFEGSQYTTTIIKLMHGFNSEISNNVFKCEQDSIKVLTRTGGTAEKILFKDNVFNVNDTRTTAIVSLEAITNSEISGNTLNNAKDGLRMVECNWSTSNTITNNKTDNVKSYVFYATSNTAGLHTIDNNIGLIGWAGSSPNYGLAALDQKYVPQAQKMYKYNLQTTDTTIGQIALTGGYYTQTTWTSGSSYTAGKYLKNASSKVYICKEAGSGTVSDEPSDTSGDEFTTEDGYKWQYVNDLPIFKNLVASS